MGKISIKGKLAINSRKIEESNAKTSLMDVVNVENDTLESEKQAEKEKLELELEQARHREQRLLAQNKARERKARTRRLIVRGAMLEKVIEESEGYTDEQINSLLEALKNKGYIEEGIAELKL